MFTLSYLELVAILVSVCFMIGCNKNKPVEPVYIIYKLSVTV
jgi:hypothetical protein